MKKRPGKLLQQLNVFTSVREEFISMLGSDCPEADEIVDRIGEILVSGDQKEKSALISFLQAVCGDSTKKRGLVCKRLAMVNSELVDKLATLGFIEKENEPAFEKMDMSLLEGALSALNVYHEKLSDEAILCKSEAIRALERYKETGESTFRINNETLNLHDFLLAFLEIMKFRGQYYKVGFIDNRKIEEKITDRLRYIEELRDHLMRIPGARFVHEYPPEYKQIRIIELIAKN